MRLFPTQQSGLLSRGRAILRMRPGKTDRATASNSCDNVRMILGIGIDLVHIPSFIETVRDARVEARMFCQEERAYCTAQPNPYVTFAGTFGVKEAVMKALGTGWSDAVDWRDIRVIRSANGAPEVTFSGGAAELVRELHVARCLVSITHDDVYAVAAAVLES